MVSVAAMPAAGDQDLPVLRADLTDAQFRTLWDRLQAIRPSLEHFAPSPHLAATALELGVAPASGGWIEIRRLGSPRGDSWALRAVGLSPDESDRLRSLLDGRHHGSDAAPEVVARRQRRHRINMRIALALAIAALGGLLAIHPLLVIPT